MIEAVRIGLSGAAQRGSCAGEATLPLSKHTSYAQRAGGAYVITVDPANTNQWHRRWTPNLPKHPVNPKQPENTEILADLTLPTSNSPIAGHNSL